MGQAKKIKHKVTNLNGIRGVLEPTMDSSSPKPFKVRRRIAEDIVEENEHDVGEASDMDPDDAAQKYKDLCEEASEAYRNACVGMVASVLASCANDVEATPCRNAVKAKSSSSKSSSRSTLTPRKDEPGSRKRQAPMADSESDGGPPSRLGRVAALSAAAQLAPPA